MQISKISKKSGLVEETIDSTVYVMDAERSLIFPMSGVASDIWKWCAELDTDAMLERICSTYEVDMGTARDDMLSFIQDLAANSLVVLE